MPDSWLDDLIKSVSGGSNMPGTDVTGPYIPPGLPDDLAIRTGGQLTNVPYGPTGPPSYAPPPAQVWDPSIQGWVTPGGNVSLTDAQQAILDSQSGGDSPFFGVARALTAAQLLLPISGQNQSPGGNNMGWYNQNTDPANRQDSSGSAGGADYGSGYDPADWGDQSKGGQTYSGPFVSPFNSNDQNYYPGDGSNPGT